MEQASNTRDFSSVSPSARWMMLWKGYTGIPYAREVAELLEYPNPYNPDFSKRDYTFWASTLGLESRYLSIDQLLNELDIPNILELSAGFSFRSLDYVRHKGVHYIDTDLPEVIATKKEFLLRLQKDTITNGKLELLPLDALDEASFLEIVRNFPAGKVVVANEGLLGYLKPLEKEKLCTTIHTVLKVRGGYWITGDIFLNHKNRRLGLQYNDEISKFNEQQQTDLNNFESFTDAQKFFNRMGFVVDKEAKIKYSEMSAFPYLKKSMTLRDFVRIKFSGRIQATWRLRAV